MKIDCFLYSFSTEFLGRQRRFVATLLSIVLQNLKTKNLPSKSKQSFSCEKPVRKAFFFSFSARHCRRSIGSIKVNLKVSTCHHTRLNWSQTTILHLQCDVLKDRSVPIMSCYTFMSLAHKDSLMLLK